MSSNLGRKMARQKRKSSAKLLKHMSRDHLDVLQNIEAILVDGHRRAQDIDDCVALDALRAALRDEAPNHPAARLLLDGLKEVREMRPNLSGQVWRDALTVVMDSVRTHSTLRPGATGYFDFVSYFVR